MLYEEIADLRLQIDGYEIERLERETSSDFTRTTSIISIHGAGETGFGEDVTYESSDHEQIQQLQKSYSLQGIYTLDKFSTEIAELDLFLGDDPKQPIFRNYRRWAFESATLDLALKQANTNLANQLNRSYKPVRFVVSTRLDEPPTGERILDWLDRNSDLEFKLDPTSDWTAETVDRLAATDAVRTLDLKGQYHGTTVDQPADPLLYKRIIEGFPDAIIEDPALTDDTRNLFNEHEDRVAWDYPIRGIGTIKDLPWEPNWLNIKPSRFGSIQSLFETIEYCLDHDIQMYGGGQFELDVGREHIQSIASLFYPDAPNDVAPKEYNDPQPGGNLATSPLVPSKNLVGLEWRY